VAAPRGDDGRVDQADVAEQQPAWGWGLAPAQAHGDVARALTDLLVNPNGYTQRQQNAVRRDIAARVGDYLRYAPVPFAGADPLSGALPPAFERQADIPADRLGGASRP
jgi:hypothetical protein